MIELLFSYGILPDKMVWFDAESFEDPDEYADVFEALIALTDSALPLETVTWELGNKINRKTSEEIFYTTVSFTMRRRDIE